MPLASAHNRWRAGALLGLAAIALGAGALSDGARADGANRFQPPAGEAAAVVPAIPAAFQGIWMTDCSAPSAAETWLKIEPRHVSFYESSGDVLAAAVEGERNLALILAFSGEGETWLDVLRLQLEPGENGPLLVDRTAGTGMARRRCRS